MHSSKELADAEREGYIRGRNEQDMESIREAKQWQNKYNVVRRCI